MRASLISGNDITDKLSSMPKVIVGGIAVTAFCFAVGGVWNAGTYVHNLHAAKVDMDHRNAQAAEFMSAVKDPENWNNIQPIEKDGLAMSYSEVMDFYTSKLVRDAAEDRAFIISDGEQTSLVKIGRTETGFVDTGVIPLQGNVSKTIDRAMGFDAPFDDSYQQWLSDTDGSIKRNPEERKGVVVVSIDRELAATDIISKFGVVYGANGTKLIDFGDTVCVTKGRLGKLSCL